ncbi:flagellar basal body L-ring protein FlgH [Roseibacterium sp. SDUM158017]|uniref:flagellar basal body L-ring protein FlgH n=1 Tax=Roseicyclus salinarum TaxID=3036773 RepID=UPI002414F1B5|nr:flagellar basal body L-ring protein FlgH [Roseibacterium sp. SDUM158017]MDG4648654.1 flagellar basal body L-ring protein FlgH [Roseibacterium sp. SDUM158017]
MNTLLRASLAASVTAILSGCTGPMMQDRNPQVAGMQLDGVTMPEMAHVSVPMPEPEIAGLPHRAERSSLWQSGSTGFFADQRAMQVGDILTINIEIDDRARLSNQSERERQGGANVGMPSAFGVQGLIGRLTGTDEGGDLVDLTAGTSAEGSGRINRAESIQLRVAATVVQQLPNGNLVVAGRQEVMVNSEIRELRVAGIIRPQDIQRDNTIDYDKIAEARITYGGRGQLTRQTRSSYGEDVVDIILPY